MTPNKMTAPDLSRAWWPAPSITPLEAVREVLAALDEGRPAGAAAAKHVATAFRMFLQGQRDITGNLGLRTRRGGRHDTDQAKERADERNALLRTAAQLAGGHNTKERIATLQRLQQVPRGEIEDEQLRIAMDRMDREFGGQIPTSNRQLRRIVDGL